MGGEGEKKRTKRKQSKGREEIENETGSEDNVTTRICQARWEQKKQRKKKEKRKRKGKEKEKKKTERTRNEREKEVRKSAKEREES